MELLGSAPSPFVRRIRLLLAGVEHKFTELDIFAQEDRKVLIENNPARKIPVLIDNDTTVYDSRVISNYLHEKLAIEPLTWPQQNLMTVVDAATDSLVIMLMSKRSGLAVNEDVMIFNLQRERVEQILLALDKNVADGDFDGWQYPEICLFSLLDWAKFRELADWQHLPNLAAFHAKSLKQPMISETAPR